MVEDMHISMRTYIGVLLGVFLEYFDYALYGFAISHIANTFFPVENPATALMLSWAVFGLSFLVRPFGAIIFGHFADRIGRKSVLIFTIVTMSVATAAMGIIPQYSQVGIIATILLLMCRIIQGLSVSTEYSGSSTYLLEIRKTHKGLLSGILTSASGIGIFAASALFMLLSAHWRFAFIIAGVTVGILGLYLRMSISESREFLNMQEHEGVAKVPLFQLLTNFPKATLMGIMISAYIGIVIIVIEVYLPNYLNNHLAISKIQTLQLSTYLTFIEAVFAVLWGLISDYIGQSKTMIIGGILMSVFIFPVFTLFHFVSIFAWFLASTMLAILVGAVDGPIAAFLVGLFPTRVRYTGVSVCYNFGAVLFGGFSPSILILLQNSHGLPRLLEPYLLISALIFLLINFIVIIDRRESQIQLIEQELAKYQEFYELSRQMHHDMRSPLASIDSIVQFCNQIPEAQRVILHNAYQRINGIANYMLNYYKDKSNSTQSNVNNVKDGKCDANYFTMPVILYLVVNEILLEKNYEYRHNGVNFVNLMLSDVYFLFAAINVNDLQRALSNIINNAVEALKHTINPTITVDLVKLSNKKVQIVISDNGPGIPDVVRDKILLGVSVTADKVGGHGIGYDQIRRTINNHGAVLGIESQKDIGSKVFITLDTIDVPSWFTQQISIKSSSIVVILDDDESIHATWDLCFAKYKLDAVVRHFYSSNECITFMQQLPAAMKQNILLLADYQLAKFENKTTTGLQVINDLQIDDAVLVTNYYNEQNIANCLQESKIKLLPKSLVPYADIMVISDNDKQQYKSVDMIIVDDDKMLVSNLKNYVLPNNKVDIYHNPEEFLANLSLYTKDTPILVDYKFPRAGISGFSICQQLKNKQFNNFYLYSGMPFKVGEVPDEIIVVMKDDFATIKRIADRSSCRSAMV